MNPKPLIAPLMLLSFAVPAVGLGTTQALTAELVAELRAAGVPVEVGAYGPLNQVTVVSAAAWEDVGPDGTSWDTSSSSRVQLNPTVGTRLVMPLELPIGAYVDSICASVYDIDGTAVSIALTGSDHDGTPSTDWSWSPESTAIGWQTVCADPDWTVGALDDLDGGGEILNWSAYQIEAIFDSSGTPAKIGPAIIIWKRQVTPAPTAPTFDDVPTNHLFFQQIEALAASCITAGCDADSYCPSAPLTRGQMAAFLAEALGLHWGRISLP